jgi:DNA-binding Lrp family transcriptional regulator
MDERRELIEVLLEDARTSTDNVARQLDVDEERVVDLLDELEGERVLRGYKAVVDWDRADTDRVEAEVEVDVDLDRETTYADIARRVGKFPEVHSLRLVSGDYDFAVTVHAESMEAVSAFVADRIAPVPEVTRTVTHFIMDTYKRRGIVFDADEDDDRLSVSP